MTLTGTSPGIGSVTLTCGDGVANGLNDGPFYTAGGISETAGDPALADSFFDIFFQADIGGTVVFNKGPLHTVAVIDRIPPLFSTYSFAGGLDVYAVLDPDGPPVAQIPAATLRLVPEPTSLALLGGSRDPKARGAAGRRPDGARSAYRRISTGGRISRRLRFWRRRMRFSGGFCGGGGGGPLAGATTSSPLSPGPGVTSVTKALSA